ncbi:M14 family zinc carboxypeptidase [Tropicimonas marinistellae]|uniref:M14 family zinc carboxypeptidase n=1 Tax=Tropicimonas marinistellae TaxID=1739787 RepID=UPI0008320FF4|nr:M14 family zinc carboxypeptidase [Tropicimonas marinistellae]
MSFQNVDDIGLSLQGLAETYPDHVEVIAMPHKSGDGQEIRALVLGDDRSPIRATVFVVGGLCPGGWLPPDALVYLAADMLKARANGAGLVYGPAIYEAQNVRDIFERLQIVVLPCANPDRRHLDLPDGLFADAPAEPGYSHAGLACRCIDLGFNQDLQGVFQRGHDDSAASVSGSKRAPAALMSTSPGQHPELRNIAWLFDTYPNARWYMDVRRVAPRSGGEGVRDARDTSRATSAGDDAHGTTVEPTWPQCVDRYVVDEAERVHGMSFGATRLTDTPSELDRILGKTPERTEDVLVDFDETTDVMREAAGVLVGVSTSDPLCDGRAPGGHWQPVPCPEDNAARQRADAMGGTWRCHGFSLEPGASRDEPAPGDYRLSLAAAGDSLSGQLAGDGWSVRLRGNVSGRAPYRLRLRGSRRIEGARWDWDFVGYLVSDEPHQGSARDTIVGSVVGMAQQGREENPHQVRASFTAVRA